MAEELKKNVGVDATLIPGDKGIFDVTVDGTLVYSKYKTERFPEPGEVTGLIKAKA